MGTCYRNNRAGIQSIPMNSSRMGLRRLPLHEHPSSRGYRQLELSCEISAEFAGLDTILLHSAKQKIGVDTNLAIGVMSSHHEDRHMEVSFHASDRHRCHLCSPREFQPPIVVDVHTNLCGYPA